MYTQPSSTRHKAKLSAQFLSALGGEVAVELRKPRLLRMIARHLLSILGGPRMRSRPRHSFDSFPIAE